MSMKQDVKQRIEYDKMDWSDQLVGSEEQMRNRWKSMTGGKFSPREFGGSMFFDSRKGFLNQQTHGVPSGLTTDEKKRLRMKVVGGNVYAMIHNQYQNDSIEEAEMRNT